MGRELPSLKELRQARTRYLNTGMTESEAFESICQQLLSMCSTYFKAAKAWERDCEKLKTKYEPRTAELSQPTTEAK